MTDAPRAPQPCALPGCSVLVEQPDDGGPPRRYCSPAHRAAARKMRHTARLEAADSAAPETPDAQQRPPAPLAAAQPPAATPELPVAAATDDWSPAASWMVSPVSLPASDEPQPAGAKKKSAAGRPKVRGPVRTKGERKTAASLLRRRAVASIAVASLVAGGSGYVLTNAAAPVTPQQAPPPQVNPETAAMEADLWAGRAEVVLASINQQLDTVAQTEATWLRLPEDVRNQVPPAVRALLDRKALLEQQRATLMSQLAALRALPQLTTDLATAQAQLDAVDRALGSAPPTSSGPDQSEAARMLAEQRDMRRQQRDHNVQELTNLQSGVQEALSRPLPDDQDHTTPLVQQVMALVENGGRGGSGDGRDRDPAPLASGRQEITPATERRSGSSGERGDVSVTAPPDPDRPAVAAVFRHGDSGRDSGRDRSGKDRGGPVGQVATAAVRTVGNVVGRDDGRHEDDGRHGSSRSDDHGDRHDRGGDKHDGDGPVTRTVGRVGDVTEHLSDAFGGSHGDNDRGGRNHSSAGDGNDERRPVGKAQRNRGGDDHEQAGSGSSKKGDREGRGRPTGKAERQRQAAERRIRDAAQRIADTVREHADPAGSDAGSSDRKRGDRNGHNAGNESGTRSRGGDNGDSDSRSDKSGRSSDRGSDSGTSGRSSDSGNSKRSNSNRGDNDRANNDNGGDRSSKSGRSSDRSGGDKGDSDRGGDRSSSNRSSNDRSSSTSDRGSSKKSDSGGSKKSGGDNGGASSTKSGGSGRGNA